MQGVSARPLTTFNFLHILAPMVLREAAKQDGAAVRRHRWQAGIKVSELAERLGVSPITLTNIENGHNAASIELIHRVAEALDVPVQDICSAHGRAALERV